MARRDSPSCRLLNEAAAEFNSHYKLISNMYDALGPIFNSLLLFNTLSPVEIQVKELEIEVYMSRLESAIGALKRDIDRVEVTAVAALLRACGQDPNTVLEIASQQLVELLDEYKYFSDLFEYVEMVIEEAKQEGWNALRELFEEFGYAFK